MRIFYAGWALVSACWAGFVWLACVRDWPRLSLDLSHTDPATQAAYGWAITVHVILYGAVVVIPVLLVFFAGRWMLRGRS